MGRTERMFLISLISSMKRFMTGAPQRKEKAPMMSTHTSSTVSSPAVVSPTSSCCAISRSCVSSRCVFESTSYPTRQSQVSEEASPKNSVFMTVSVKTRQEPLELSNGTSQDSGICVVPQGESVPLQVSSMKTLVKVWWKSSTQPKVVKWWSKKLRQQAMQVSLSFVGTGEPARRAVWIWARPEEKVQSPCEARKKQWQEFAWKERARQLVAKEWTKQAVAKSGMRSSLTQMDLLKLTSLNRFFFAKVELLIFLVFSTSSSTSISPFVSSTCSESRNFSVFEENCWIWISEMSRKISKILMRSLLILWITTSMMLANSATNSSPPTNIRISSLIKDTICSPIASSRATAAPIITSLICSLFASRYCTVAAGAAEKVVTRSAAVCAWLMFPQTLIAQLMKESTNSSERKVWLAVPSETDTWQGAAPISLIDSRKLMLSLQILVKRATVSGEAPLASSCRPLSRVSSLATAPMMRFWWAISEVRAWRAVQWAAQRKQQVTQRERRPAMLARRMKLTDLAKVKREMNSSQAVLLSKMTSPSFRATLSSSLLTSLLFTRFLSTCSSSTSSITWIMFSRSRSVLIPSAQSRTVLPCFSDSAYCSWLNCEMYASWSLKLPKYLKNVCVACTWNQNWIGETLFFRRDFYAFDSRACQNETMLKFGLSSQLTRKVRALQSMISFSNCCLRRSCSWCAFSSSPSAPLAVEKVKKSLAQTSPSKVFISRPSSEMMEAETPKIRWVGSRAKKQWLGATWTVSVMMEAMPVSMELQFCARRRILTRQPLLWVMKKDSSWAEGQRKSLMLSLSSSMKSSFSGRFRISQRSQPKSEAQLELMSMMAPWFTSSMLTSMMALLLLAQSCSTIFFSRLYSSFTVWQISLYMSSSFSMASRQCTQRLVIFSLCAILQMLRQLCLTSFRIWMRFAPTSLSFWKSGWSSLRMLQNSRLISAARSNRFRIASSSRFTRSSLTRSRKFLFGYSHNSLWIFSFMQLYRQYLSQESSWYLISSKFFKASSFSPISQRKTAYSSCSSALIGVSLYPSLQIFFTMFSVRRICSSSFLSLPSQKSFFSGSENSQREGQAGLSHFWRCISMQPWMQTLKMYSSLRLRQQRRVLVQRIMTSEVVHLLMFSSSNLSEQVLTCMSPATRKAERKKKSSRLRSWLVKQMMLTISRASTFVPRKLSSISFIFSVTCSSLIQNSTTSSPLVRSRITSCVTSIRKQANASFRIRQAEMARGMKADLFILRNSFLCLIKSKLKKVWASISEPNRTKERMAMAQMQALQEAQHCLKGAEGALLQLYMLSRIGFT